MSQPPPDLIDDRYCFACGDNNNKEGLDVHWNVEGRTTWSEFTAPRKFQGWKGIVHGGIVATLLDEAMTRLAWIISGGALTAEMTVRFLRPAPVGEKLLVVGEIVEENRKLVRMKACLYRGGRNGERIAESTGTAIKLKKGQKAAQITP